VEGLHGRVFMPLKEQHPRTDVNTAWFASCKLSICMAALVDSLQTACGMGLMRTNTLGSLGPASSYVLWRMFSCPMLSCSCRPAIWKNWGLIGPVEVPFNELCRHRAFFSVRQREEWIVHCLICFAEHCLFCFISLVLR